MGATTGGFNNDYDSGMGCAIPSQGGSGPDRVFSVALPAHKRLEVLVDPTGFDVMVSFVTAAATTCSQTETICVASRDAGGNNAREQVSYVNATDAEQTVLVIVDGFAPDDAGEFTITADITDPPPTLTPGDQCESAPTLTAGTLIHGSIAGLSNNYGTGTGCAGTGGIDGAYAIEIPIGQRLTATVTPTTQWNPSLNLVAGPASACEAMPRTCLSSRDVSQLGAEKLTYTNVTGAPLSVFVIVDTSMTNTTGAFDLLATLDTPPPDEVCAGATILTPGTTVTGTTVGYGHDYSTGNNCTGTPGPDRVYQIDVPAGRTLTATVTPTGTPWDVSMSLMLGPASNCVFTGRNCLLGSNQGGPGSAETVTYRNATSEQQTIFVFIDSPTASGAGTFTLVASLRN
jgi:hypothetical protein